MRLQFAAILAVAAALLTGCAVAPQQPLSISKDFTGASTTKVGVVMSTLPKVDTEFPGAGCLLCLAAASVANQSLTKHVQTLTAEDLPKLKNDIARLLEAKGMQVRVIDEPLDLKQIPKYDGKEPNTARQDFRGLKNRYQVDKLVVIDIAALGAWRNYSAYIPTGDPKAVLKGSGYIVNLSTNMLEWYLPVNVQKGTDQNWDEPPKFPGLTNAYFEAIEQGKDAFSKPFL